jgi:hypothetical protein
MSFFLWGFFIGLVFNFNHARARTRMRRGVNSASVANLGFNDREYLTIWFTIVGKSPTRQGIFWEIFLPVGIQISTLDICLVLSPRPEGHESIEAQGLPGVGLFYIIPP